MEAGMPWREFEIMNREGQSDNSARRWPGAGESNGNRAHEFGRQTNPHVARVKPVAAAAVLLTINGRLCNER
jgi:hypothetical protein